MLWAHTNTHTTHHIQEKLSYLPRFTGKHVCYSGSINQGEQILSRAGLVTHRRLCHVSQVKVCTFKVLPKCLPITWGSLEQCANKEVPCSLALALSLSVSLSLKHTHTRTHACTHASTQRWHTPLQPLLAMYKGPLSSQLLLTAANVPAQQVTWSRHNLQHHNSMTYLAIHYNTVITTHLLCVIN